MIERIAIWISWKLPRVIAYWAFIRVATEGQIDDPPRRTCMQAADAFARHSAIRPITPYKTEVN